ncbi:MAG: ABC transporter substrate-binding protein [Boseongicola sp. SB0670_bin_30]|nr:ABC transporter substrate-binding protein [Boseongicola sp. SB0670_bin_30]
MRINCLTIAAALLTATALDAGAETLRWARAGDSLTLDPHAQNEGPTSALAHQMMEPLVLRDMTGKIVPALATEWGPSESDPNVWTFKLREGVKFHDGAEFDSEDAVFSFNRAMTPESDFKTLLASVREVRAPERHVFEIVTDGPNPIMPANLTNIFILDKDWAQANNAVKVQDYGDGKNTHAARNANGTGPYKLVSREPDTRTVLTINEDYWGKEEFPMEVTEIVYTPIMNGATRVAALLSGEVDFIQDVPVQDIARVASSDGLDVRTALQNRVIFFGMNVGDDDLATDNVDGRNPFADIRVRQAINIAIDRDAIKKIVMRDQSRPTGVVMPPFVNGWTEALDQAPEPDIATAKALMAEAGYGNGFSIRLNCPNDRYINDEAICRAAVGMLAQIGISVAMEAQPKAQHFQRISNLKSDFYLLGWGVQTYDSEHIFNFLVHSRDEWYGSWNGTRFSDADLDARIEALATEIDLTKRDRMIAEIWQAVQDQQIYVPIHHQVLNWGMKSNIQTTVASDDTAKFKFFRLD